MEPRSAVWLLILSPHFRLTAQSITSPLAQETRCKIQEVSLPLVTQPVHPAILDRPQSFRAVGTRIQCVPCSPGLRLGVQPKLQQAPWRPWIQWLHPIWFHHISSIFLRSTRIHNISLRCWCHIPSSPIESDDFPIKPAVLPFPMFDDTGGSGSTSAV